MTTTKLLLQEKFPFLTIIKHLNQEHLGIIQNADQLFVSMYIMDNTFTANMKQDFLDCGDTWWWESNRQIPINMFVKTKFAQFKPYLRVFASKDTEIIQGPIVNLKDTMNKRVKRRTIQLVRTN